MGVNNKDFAAIRGVDPSRVSQWKRQGRLILDADGKIDAAATNAALDASLDQVKGARRAGNVTSSSPAPGPAGGNGQALPLEGPADRQSDAGDRGHGAKADSDYWAHKSTREKAEAQLSSMRALREAGALTAVSGVRKEWTDLARKLRNDLLAIPDRTAQVLDPTNPARAHKLLTDEITRALNELRIGLEERAASAARADEPEEALL